MTNCCFRTGENKCHAGRKKAKKAPPKKKVPAKKKAAAPARSSTYLFKKFTEHLGQLEQVHLIMLQDFRFSSSAHFKVLS